MLSKSRLPFYAISATMELPGEIRMSKETILVVDDERNIVELAQMYLEQAGYRV